MSHQSDHDLGNEIKKDRYAAALNLFISARTSFQATIPEQDRSSFTEFLGSDSFMKDIEAQINKSPEKNRLYRCCKKIDNFAKRWQPFFEITDIFVSSHPEWAALAWGAVRLVFKLCGHYTMFFEKLAEMFERISMKLPHFGRHLLLFNRRKNLRPDIERHSDLVHTLACMFKDIIQFCQEACRIFSPKERGVRYKLNVIKDLFWKPFDARFSDLLSRLDQYQEMYEPELNLADREELMGHYEFFDKYLDEYKQDRECREGQSRREETLLLRQQIHSIKEWINAPDYMATFERERITNSSDAGSWLLEDNRYRSWRQSWIGVDSIAGEASPAHEFASRILYIYGSPGYGKTVLSTKVIEDLALEERTSGDVPPRTLAFFHFDKMNYLYKDPSQAMRAVLNQLIHKNRNDRELIDAATILMDVEGSGQVIASESEVASLLKLFFERYPTTALVFDGVDECSDPKTFLSKFYAICSSSQCKLILFSRPDLTIPSVLQHECQQIHLHHGANFYEIGKFVQSRMQELVTCGLLPTLDTDSAVNQITIRSNSLFLWAKLMMDFLNCPALSPGERLDAISHLNLLEGLEQLYTEILKMIRTKFRQEISTAYKAFSWIIVAHRPLKLLELQAGLAVQIGKRSSPGFDFISNFRQSIIRICGALIEIHEDSTVHFIHLSVQEFLTNTGPSSTIQGNPSSPHVPLIGTHIKMASLCLSYIIHDVPGEPLSGSRIVKAHLPSVEARLPFLRYAIDWPTHVIGALETKNQFPAQSSESSRAFYDTIKTFLDTKSAIAVWLESIWAFDASPRIREASGYLEVWLREIKKGAHPPCKPREQLAIITIEQRNYFVVCRIRVSASRMEPCLDTTTG
ncbi:hypothetical protein F4781DRAFT_38570 [Annulohypoxylon bovei var. microspora]|nr:hypothetical protein F4781DRAFT_38570 [Annulohypoxylon bovei var. microspora]